LTPQFVFPLLMAFSFSLCSFLRLSFFLSARWLFFSRYEKLQSMGQGAAFPRPGYFFNIFFLPPPPFSSKTDCFGIPNCLIDYVRALLFTKRVFLSVSLSIVAPENRRHFSRYGLNLISVGFFFPPLLEFSRSVFYDTHLSVGRTRLPSMARQDNRFSANFFFCDCLSPPNRFGPP